MFFPFSFSSSWLCTFTFLSALQVSCDALAVQAKRAVVHTPKGRITGYAGELRGGLREYRRPLTDACVRRLRGPALRGSLRAGADGDSSLQGPCFPAPDRKVSPRFMRWYTNTPLTLRCSYDASGLPPACPQPGLDTFSEDCLFMRCVKAWNITRTRS